MNFGRIEASMRTVAMTTTSAPLSIPLSMPQCILCASSGQAMVTEKTKDSCGQVGISGKRIAGKGRL